MPCSEKQCLGSIYMPSNDNVPAGELKPLDKVKEEAVGFFQEYFASLKKYEIL